MGLAESMFCANTWIVPAGGRDDDLRRDSDVRGFEDPSAQLVGPTARTERDLLGPHARRDLARPSVHLGAHDGAAVESHGVGSLDHPVEQVGDAEEPRDERGLGTLVEIGRTAELLDLAGVHDRDPVRHRHRLFLVVRDVDERDADVVLDRLELELHLLAELQVERAERLVEEEHARLVDERARERYPLLLAAGELAWLALLEALEADEPQDLVHAAAHVLLAHALPAQAERDVLEDRQVREEGVRLEDRVDVALVGRLPGDGLLAEVDRALGRLLEAADHPQRRRLAAAGRAEEREEAAPLDLEREVVDGGDLVEPLDHVVEPNVDVRVARRLKRGLVLGFDLALDRHQPVPTGERSACSPVPQS